MEIGRYYQKQGSVNAAINRFQNVVKEYQTTAQAPEALHRLAGCISSLGLRNEATRIAARETIRAASWMEDTQPGPLRHPAQRARIADGLVLGVHRTVKSL